MIIQGIGTDIVSVSRIKKLLATYGAKFVDKVLTRNESAKYRSLSTSKQVSYLAKRFAAKESVAKALGTGITQDCTFHDIEIDNDPSGKPIVHLSKKTETRVLKTKNYSIFLSISDERILVIAYCIIIKDSVVYAVN